MASNDLESKIFKLNKMMTFVSINCVPLSLKINRFLLQLSALYMDKIIPCLVLLEPAK